MSIQGVTVIGGGLAGCECAHQLARRGIPVTLYEMRPDTPTPVHTGGDLAELVCSNSLRSDDPHHPSGLLKREMALLGSLILEAARSAAVPAGSALAVDRRRFSLHVMEAIAENPLIELVREEITQLPEGEVVVATGPLTSPALHEALTAWVGEDLYFYDALSPAVTAESLDMSRLFFGSRYGKGDDDYLNAPMDRATYEAFVEALIKAEIVPLPEHEKALFFEGCLPIEEMARRGRETLAYGPLKPVGFTDPATEKRPWALLQLRRENLDATAFSLVGCQTRLTWPEQKRVFHLIPGLENAKFIRYGIVHRNTFINAPRLIDPFLRLKDRPSIMFAGQITGVEGYMESAATGLLAGRYLAARILGESLSPIPGRTALGGLMRHLTESEPKRFQPSNITFGLIEGGSRKRRRETAERALAALREWLDE